MTTGTMMNTTTTLTTSLSYVVLQLVFDTFEELNDFICCHGNGIEVLYEFTTEPILTIVFLSFHSEELKSDLRIFKEDLCTVVFDPLFRTT